MQAFLSYSWPGKSGVSTVWKLFGAKNVTLKDVCSKGEDVIDQKLCGKFLDEGKNFEVGPIVTKILPGSDWSGWSQPYEHSGDKITSPSPRKFASIRATLLTDDPYESATLRSVTLNFINPVAANVVGEIKPPVWISWVSIRNFPISSVPRSILPPNSSMRSLLKRLPASGWTLSSSTWT